MGVCSCGGIQSESDGGENSGNDKQTTGSVSCSCAAVAVFVTAGVVDVLMLGCCSISAYFNEQFLQADPDFSLGLVIIDCQPGDGLNGSLVRGVTNASNDEKYK